MLFFLCMFHANIYWYKYILVQLVYDVRTMHDACLSNRTTTGSIGQKAVGQIRFETCLI